MRNRRYKLNLIGLFLFVAYAASCSASSSHKTADTWIISGQSNACGMGKLPGPKPLAKVTVYDIKAGKWIPAQDPLPSSGNHHGVGPWVYAAQAVCEHAHKSIRITGHVHGGGRIALWDQGKPDWASLVDMMRRHGDGAKVFLWYQGESDAMNMAQPVTIKYYQDKLDDLAQRIKKCTGNDKIIFVIVQLAGAVPSHPDKTDFMAVREAQRRFVAASKHAVLVPAIGIKRRDALHLSREGYQELGHDIAKALLKVCYKKKSSWPGPVLDRAFAAKASRKAFAHFAETRSLKGVLASDFAAKDKDGYVKCVKASSKKMCVTLEFERGLKKPATLIYGYGDHPKATLRDEDGNRAPAVQVKIRFGKGKPKHNFTKAVNGAGALSHRK